MNEASREELGLTTRTSCRNFLIWRMHTASIYGAIFVSSLSGFSGRGLLEVAQVRPCDAKGVLERT